MNVTPAAQIAGYLTVDRAIFHIIHSSSVWDRFEEKSAAIGILGDLRTDIADDMPVDAYLTALTVSNIRSEYISTPHGLYA